MNIQCKIRNWQLRLKKREYIISVVKDDAEMKQIKTKLFKDRGMKMLPPELYQIICKDLAAANVYDKFLDKYYEWDEDDAS